MHPCGKWRLWCGKNQVFREIYNMFGKAGGKRKRREIRRYAVFSSLWLSWKKLKEETFFPGFIYLQSIKIYFQTSLERNSINFLYISILSVDFENLTVRLHVLIIFFMHVKFQENQRLIAISSNKC